MVGDCVQGVAPKFVVAHEDEEKVELNPAFDVDDLVLSLAHLLGLHDRLADRRPDVLDAAQESEAIDVEVLRSGGGSVAWLTNNCDNGVFVLPLLLTS